MAVIRREKPGDAPVVREVNRRAFGRNTEADIVDALRKSCAEGISLVAQMDYHLVGHILFTPVAASADGHEVRGMGLGPMSVLPEHQGKGIGSAMLRCGIEKVRQAGYPFIVVLGHSSYYPRFGFRPASCYNLTCEYAGVPDEAFMALVLDEADMKDVAGVVKYRPEFSAAT